jgi:hypothetical protein
MNNHNYPKVHYPEVYILGGGYAQFFKDYPVSLVRNTHMYNLSSWYRIFVSQGLMFAWTILIIQENARAVWRTSGKESGDELVHTPTVTPTPGLVLIPTQVLVSQSHHIEILLLAVESAFQACSLRPMQLDQGESVAFRVRRSPPWLLWLSMNTITKLIRAEVAWNPNALRRVRVHRQVPTDLARK